MLKGTIIENSLSDKSILQKVRVERTWQDGDWILHDVQIDEKDVLELSKYLAEGPWYIHLWQPDQDKVLVVFKDKLFTINYSDKSTWAEAVGHGKLLGIPPEQLDFLIR